MVVDGRGCDKYKFGFNQEYFGLSYGLEGAVKSYGCLHILEDFINIPIYPLVN